MFLFKTAPCQLAHPRLTAKSIERQLDREYARPVLVDIGNRIDSLDGASDASVHT